MASRTLTVKTVGQPDKTITINRDRFAGVRTMTRQDADGSSKTITIDRSPTGTKYGDKPGQSRPLLDKVVGGAAAAYSLRDLNDAIGSTNVVEVRRDSDDAEKTFKAQDVNKIANWVNGKQETTLPADVDPASAAYSLRKVKAGYTGDAVRIRRASDDVEVNVAFDTNGEVSASSLIEQAELGLNRAGVILFDGVNDDIDVNAALLPATDDFTLTINAFVEKNPATNENLFGQGSLGTNGRMVFQVQGDGTAEVFIASFGVLTTSNAVNLGEVNTFVLSRSGTTISLQLNNGTAVTGTSSVAIQQINSTIGGAYAGDNFEGSIQSLTVGSVSWDGKQSSAESLGWTVNGSPKLSVVVGATTLGDFLTGNENNLVDFSSGSDNLFSHDDQTTIAFEPYGNDLSRTAYNHLTDSESIGSSPVSTSDYSFRLDSRVSSGYSAAPGILIGPKVEQYFYSVTFKYYIPEGEPNLTTVYGTAAAPLNVKGAWTEATVTSQVGQSHRNFLLRSAAFGSTGGLWYIADIRMNLSAFDTYVQTWYDQSGNNYHLTQDTAGSQPKIAEAGALLTLAGKPTIRPDGSDDFLINENAIWDTITNINLSCMAVTEKTSLTNRILWGIGSSGGEDSDWLMGGGSVAGAVSFRGNRINSLTSSIGTSGATLLTALDVAGGDGFVDGTAIGSPNSATRNVTADRLVLFTRRGTSSLGTCTDQGISEIIFYNSDQSSNRFKIESNINNHYGIYTSLHNGFVETWYDQSGNGRDAEQPTNDNQPKIVSNGSYLGEVDFDGIDDVLGFTQIPLSSSYAMFGVFDNSALPSDFIGRSAITSNSYISLQPDGDIYWETDTNNDGIVNVNTGTPASGTNLLSCLLAASGTGTAFLNGTSGASASFANTNLTVNQLGGRGTTIFNEAQFKEIIIYNSDQSANRPAIEANIANQYNLTLS